MTENTDGGWVIEGELSGSVFSPIPMPQVINPPALPVPEIDYKKELENFDIYQSADGQQNGGERAGQNFKNSKSSKYPTDPQGFLTLPTTPIYDVQNICNKIRERIGRDPKTWTEKLPNGFILHLGSSGTRSKVKTTNYIPYHFAVEFFVALITRKAEISFSTTPRILDTSENTYETDLHHLELYSWTFEVLRVMQNFDVSSWEILLRYSTNTQLELLYATVYAMADSLRWLASHKENWKNQLYPASVSKDHDEIMEDAEDLAVEHIDNALSALWNASQVLNRIMQEEIFAYHRNAGKVEAVARKIEKKIRIPLEWFSIILRKNISVCFSKMIIQVIGLVKNIPLPEPSSDILTVWDCFCSLTTTLFHLCASDEYASILLASPDAEVICHGFSCIFEQLKTQETKAAHLVRYHMLRILTVLCEKDDPYFLDRLNKMSCSGSIADHVIREASKIVFRVHEAVGGADINEERFVTAREAFRVMELFSYDSNFVTVVIEKGTFFMLQFLSVPSPNFVKYFQAKNSYQEYVSILMFRLVANLHCFNPAVSPEGQQGKFVRQIVDHCSTLFAVDEEGNIVRNKALSTPLVIANLFYLFQWITFRYCFTVQEHNFWQDFLSLLESTLQIKFPVIRVPGMQLPSTPKVKPEPSSTERAATEPVRRSKVLRGFNASFGVVSDTDGLRDLIKANGGSVLEYVSKTVTHIVCAEDNISLQGSAAKIQAAIAKQVPAVSEKFVYDSIAKGELLNERTYLISNHPYKRRRI